MRFYDAVVRSKRISVTMSAGNDGPAEGTVESPSIAFNVLSVGNVYDQNTLDRSDDVIASNSSRGPSSAGRKKPDICAPGTHIWGPNKDGSWENSSGTSIAAPHVAGAAALLHDVGVHDPVSIKAILINTADFLHGQTTWDNAYGWGYMNLDTAFLRRTDYFEDEVMPRNTPGSYKLYKVPNAQVGDKATLVWERHAHYNLDGGEPTEWYPLNDLNLRFYRESNGGAHSASLSGIDNVEQVVSTTTGDLVLKAYAWSTSFSHTLPYEYYSLAVPPGTVEASGPNIRPRSQYTTYSPPINAQFLVRIRVDNTGDLHAHNCMLDIQLPAGITLISGSLSGNVGRADAGSGSEWVDLWLKATTTGTKTINMAVSSLSYGVPDWEGTRSFTVNPGPADTVPPHSTLVIGQPTHQTGGVEKVINGGFESNLMEWTTTGIAEISTSDFHSGSKSLKLGMGSGTASQSIYVTSSASNAFLTFWYKCAAGLLSTVGCRIRDEYGNLIITPFIKSSSVADWTKVTIDLSRFKGRTITIQFYSSGGVLGSSVLYVDDVSLKENETVWVRQEGLHEIVARDDASGVYASNYRRGTESWWTYEWPFSLHNQPDGLVNVYYRSIDLSANIEPTISTALHLDSQAPRSVLRVSGPRLVSGGVNRVINGGFENGLTGWISSGEVTTVTEPVYAGSRAARVGGTGSGSLHQDIPIDFNSSLAVASVWIRSAPGMGATTARMSVIDPLTNLVCYSISGALPTDWTEYTWDVTRFKGSHIRLKFEVIHASGLPASIFVDEVRMQQNADVYILPSTTMTIHSAERSGVKKYESKIGYGSYVEGQTFSIGSQGLQTVRYRAMDNLGQQEPDVVTSMTIPPGPGGSIRINDGASNTTSRNVTLTLSATAQAGVQAMRIQSDTGVWGDWQTYQTSMAYTLSEGFGVKTLRVRYRDALGQESPEFVASIEYIDMIPISIAEVKMQPISTRVSLTGKVVTAIFPLESCFYISEPNRSAGIRVVSGYVPSSLNVSMDLTGYVAVLDGEREIILEAFNEHGPVSEIKPIGIVNSRLGGSAFHHQPGIPGASDLNNIGLLVTSWGRVTKVEGSNFYIDDGSSSSPSVGLRVNGQDIGLTPPAIGQYVQVTGISGASTVGGTLIRVLRPRSANDVRVRRFNVAFICDGKDNLQFKSLLDSKGASTDLFAVGDIRDIKWAKYHIVIVGHHTYNWFNSQNAVDIVESSLPVVAIGEGGAKFLDAVKSPSLFIGWQNSIVDKLSYGMVYGGDVYSYPYDLGLSPGDMPQLFTISIPAVVLYDEDGISNGIIRHHDQKFHFPVASEDRFYQWGFTETPNNMTDTGRYLFVNLVYAAVSPQD